MILYMFRSRSLCVWTFHGITVIHIFKINEEQKNLVHRLQAARMTCQEYREGDNEEGLRLRCNIPSQTTTTRLLGLKNMRKVNVKINQL